MHVVRDACPEMRPGLGAKRWKNKRLNKVIHRGVGFSVTAEVGQTKLFLLTACYTA